MNKRLITSDDLTAFTFAGSPALSQDGTKAVYVVTKTDLKQNGYTSALYWTDGEGSPKPLTYDYTENTLVKHHSPCFSADSTYVYYLSNRTGTDQVWRISLFGGESERVTEFENGVQSFALSPNGKQVVCQTILKDEKNSDNSDVTVITRLRYLQNGQGFVDGTSALYLFSIEDKYRELISNPSCDAELPVFAPEGNRLYFCMGKADPDQSDYLLDLYAFDLSARTTTRIYEAKGTIYDSQISPDGKTIALAGNEDGECTPENITILLIPSTGGTARNLTKNEHLSLGNFIGTDVRFDAGHQLLAWAKDGQSLTYLVQDGPISGLKSVNLRGEYAAVFMKDEHVMTSFSMKNGTIAAIISTPLSTGDLYFLGNGDTVRQISNHNQQLFEQLDVSKPISFTYKGADGWKIDGWLLMPPESFPTTDKVPVVLEIHGGPAAAYGDSFNHEFQCLAAQGYAVVYTNPRGSRGYGAEFCAGCYGDWGRKDKIDIIKGLDYVLDHFPKCDRDRQYVTGGSYGGFMTNTIVGTTNRFRAAVTQRSICNLYNFFGTSDIGYYFLTRYFNGADLWSDEDLLMSFSPIRNANKVNTPICIIHSEQDHRCPIEQAEQWYVALRRLGVTTRFVRIKGENHELSRSGRPQNRLTRLHEIISWFNRYTTIETIQ
ncbi:S9 family peptidase [Sporolactobacillus nakayamae]|uniref:Dipeptidyl aminopeptidase/acylaminoacyl peptidase n=1 Tax=Sporolactobacillus nakayamae TaxID=269670 RepID=A0A1I2SQV0_9BACL|nr:S9 family peptidase [Sporolactobacillus nakayamae]SFG54139.1 Dipeptidyl aminopeptidase/acylaminoacyl peptidase [Sporolactobacillus nakayamae]